MSSFAHVVETNKSLTEAVIAVRRAAEAMKWGVLGGYDVSEILESKGFAQSGRIKLIDICAPGHADFVLEKAEMVALFMPCTIALFERGGKTKIAAMRASAVVAPQFPEQDDSFLERLRQVDDEVRQILEAAGA